MVKSKKKELNKPNVKKVPTRMERYHTVLNIIRDLDKKGQATNREIIRAAQEKGVDEIQTGEFIEQCLRTGLLYEPRPREYRLIDV